MQLMNWAWSTRRSPLRETEGKPTVLVINKWDLAEEGGAQRDQYEEWLRDRLPGLRYAPIVYTCALTGKHVDAILAIAQELRMEAEQQVPTSELEPLVGGPPFSDAGHDGSAAATPSCIT